MKKSKNQINYYVNGIRTIAPPLLRKIAPPPVRVGVRVKVKVNFWVGGQPDNCPQ